MRVALNEFSIEFIFRLVGEWPPLWWKKIKRDWPACSWVMIMVGREEIFSFSAGGGPVFSIWPNNCMRERHTLSAYISRSIKLVTSTCIISPLLNYLCDDCIQTPLSPGVVPGVWVQHACPDTQTQISRWWVALSIVNLVNNINNWATWTWTYEMN